MSLFVFLFGDGVESSQVKRLGRVKAMNASIKRAPRKAEKTRIVTRSKMLAELPIKKREIIQKADKETKAFLLDVLRLGKAGIL